MAGHKFIKLLYDASGTDTFTLVAGGSSIVDVDLDQLEGARFNVSATYAATASTTGYSLEVRYGMGPNDSAATGYQVPCVLGGAASSIEFSDNGDAVTTATMTPSSGASVTKTTFFSTNDLRTRVPRWIRLVFTNLDVTNPATIRIYGDC